MLVQFVGIMILLLVVVDVFMTVLSLKGGGPLTGLWTRIAWRVCLSAHRRLNVHRTLTLVGPVMLLMTVVVWYLGLVAGWFLVLFPTDGNIINATTHESATVLEKLYFLGTTISTVGYGDYVPKSFPWTLSSNLIAATATFSITTSLSYILPVVSIGLKKRDIAREVFALGECPAEVVHLLWSDEKESAGNAYIQQLATQLNSHSHQHLVYPILHYFHAAEKNASSARALLLMSDAIFMARNVLAEKHRPSDAVFTPTLRLIENYATLSFREGNEVMPLSEELLDETQLGPEALQRYDVAVEQSIDLEQALKAYRPLRRQLLLLCGQDGW